MDTNTRNILIAVVAVVAIVAVIALAQPREDNSLGGRLNSAMEKLSDGVKDAGKELKPESQKTIGEKIGDAVEDAGKNIKGTR